MLAWLSANLVNLVVLALIALGVVLAIRSLMRDKRAGRSTCGGNCALCGGCSRVGNSGKP